MSSDTALRVLDTSGQGLSKVSQFSKKQTLQDVAAVIADGNSLSTLHGIEQYPSLVQLSACDNSLVRMDEVAPLINLVTLNLQANSIMDITGLEHLVNLQWLCLAGNSIKTMHGLSGNGRLSHLDLSDNCISELQDITILTQLKTLLLHGNAILSLKSVGECLPSSVNTLTLAENDVPDLNEVSFLAAMKSLTQLSFMSNPAVSVSDSMMFDYRPYVIYWCPGLSTLDGLTVTPEERQQSSTLFPPNQPHPFALGEHWALVQYLTSVCPLVGLQTLIPGSVLEDVENINPNSQLFSLSTSLSLSGLEEALKSGGPDTLKKLKALQLVEQMISAQEQLLRSQQAENSTTDAQDVTKPFRTETFNSNEKTPSVPTSGRQDKGELSLKPGPTHHEKECQPVSSEDEHYTSQDEKLIAPVPVGGERNKLDSEMITLSAGGGSQTPPDEKTSTANESQTVKSLSLQERKQQQLKLLNQKIAQRHSRLPHKTRATSNSKPSVEARLRKPTTSHTGKHIPKSHSSSSVTRGRMAVSSSSHKPNKKDEHSHLPSRSGGVATSKSTPTVSSSLVKKPSSTHFKSTNIPLLQNSAIKTTKKGTPSKPETTTLSRTENVQTPDPNVAEESDDMLDSISEYIPLPDDSTVGGGLPFDFSDTDTLYDVSSLTCSLTQAYGMSHLKDSSQLLSSLVGPAHVNSETQHYTITNDSGVVTQMTSVQTPMPVTFTCDVHSGWSTTHGDVDSSMIQSLADTGDAPPTTPPTNGSGYTTLHDDGVPGQNHIQPHIEVEGVGGEEAAIKIQAVYRGYLTRKRLGSWIKEHKAATLIQAAWRGYCARCRDPEVMRVRSELSRMKLEAYVAMLYGQLQGCRQELAHQASVSQLQEETLQSLLVEVEGLRKWRSEVESKRRQKAAVVIQSHWRGYAVRKVRALKLTSNSKALSAQYQILKEEVKEMQLTLVTVLDKIRLLGENGQRSPKMGYSEAEMPPATDLTMSHFSSSCVLLRWTPASSPGRLTTVLQGYRIYVNGVPEGMVGASKSKAYIEGLDRDTTYRITIRAVYNNGESCDSNPIVASLSSQRRGVKLNPSPPLPRETKTITNKTHSSHTSQSNTDETPPLQQQSEPPVTESSTTGSVDVSGHTLSSLLHQHQSIEANCHHTQRKPPSTSAHNSNQPHSNSQGSSSHSTSLAVTVASSTSPDQIHSGNDETGVIKPPPLNDTSTPEPSNIVSVVGLHSDDPLSSATQVDDGSCGGVGGNESGMSMEEDAVPPARHITYETVSVMSGATEEYTYTGSSRSAGQEGSTLMRNESLDSDDSLSELESDAQEIKQDREPQNEQQYLLVEESPLLSPGAVCLSLQDKTPGVKDESESNCLQTSTINNVLTTLVSSIQQVTPVESTTITHSHHTLPTSTSTAHSNTSSSAVPQRSMVAHPSCRPFDEISGCQTKHVPSLMHNVVGHGHQQASTLATTDVPFEPDSLTTAHYSPTTTTTTTTNTISSSTAHVGGVHDIQDENKADVVLHTEVIRSVSNAVVTDCSRGDQLQGTVQASVASIPCTPQTIPPKMLLSEQTVNKSDDYVNISSGIEGAFKAHLCGTTNGVVSGDNYSAIPLIREGKIDSSISMENEHHSTVSLGGMENSSTSHSQVILEDGGVQVEGEADLESVTDHALSVSKESIEKPEPDLPTTSEGGFEMPPGTPEVKDCCEFDEAHLSLESHTPCAQAGTSSSAVLASQLLSQLEADLRETRNT